MHVFTLITVGTKTDLRNVLQAMCMCQEGLVPVPSEAVRDKPVGRGGGAGKTVC